MKALLCLSLGMSIGRRTCFLRLVSLTAARSAVGLAPVVGSREAR